MSRDFGKIRSSIWQSRKFLALQNDQTRLLYLYLHTCPHGNSVGCFRLPKGYALADMSWPVEAFDSAIEELCKVNLIGWDESESVVRLVDFLKHSGITNQKHAAGALKAAISLPDCLEKQILFNELGDMPFIDKKTIPKATLKQPDRPIESPIPTETTTETNTSVPNGTDGKAVDPVKRVYDIGKDLLGRYGKSKSASGAFITKLLKTHDPPEVMRALLAAGEQERHDIIAFITGALRNDKTEQAESIDREGLLDRLRARGEGGRGTGVDGSGGDADAVLPAVSSRH